MGLYRVDKREQQVMLFLADGIVRDGQVFLSPFNATGSGPQTLLSLLREKEAFFPFRTADGTFALINKSALSHVRYHPADEDGLSLGTAIRVQITFFGGELLEGQIYLAMPEGQNRLQDFINSSPGFFALDHQEAHYIVNGTLVREIAQI